MNNYYKWWFKPTSVGFYEINENSYIRSPDVIFHSVESWISYPHYGESREITFLKTRHEILVIKYNNAL